MLRKAYDKVKTRIMGAVISAMVLCMMAVPCFAEDPATPDVVSIMSGAATDIVSKLLLMVGAVVTAVVGLFVLKIGVTYGFKFIKQLIGKAG